MEWIVLVSNNYWSTIKKSFLLVYITIPAKKEEKPEDGEDENSLQLWKNGYLDVIKTKEKQLLDILLI